MDDDLEIDRKKGRVARECSVKGMMREKEAQVEGCMCP